VDLFRADEEWIGPIMDVPAPLLLVFTFIMFTLSFVITASFLRACCRLRHAIQSGHQYVINNRGLLEPLGSNVVIIDGSSKIHEDDDNEQVYFIPVVVDNNNNTTEGENSTNTQIQNEQQQNSTTTTTTTTNSSVALQVDPTDPRREPLLEREQQTQ